MRRVPIRLKIAAFAAALVALAVGLLAFFTVIEPWRAKLASQDNLARGLVKSAIAAMGVEYRIDGSARLDAVRVHDLVSNSSRGAGVPIVYALLRDEEDNLDGEASAVNAQLLQQVSEPLAQLYLRERRKGLEVLASQGTKLRGLRRLTIRLAVPEVKGTIGRLELGLSTLAIDAELRRTLLRDAVVLAGTMLLAIVGAFFIARRIAQPLAELSSAMGRLQQGDFEVRSEIAHHVNDEVGDLSRAFNAMADGLKERERLRGTLGRYVSGDVADRILEESDDLKLPGETRRVTVMFLDVRGFTTMSERLTPTEVVALLNEYFDVVVDRVQAHGGTVNKFIGDAAMCIWGAPRQIDAPEREAVFCAMEIQEAAAKLSADRSGRGLTSVGFGIGINAGEVVAGNLGAARRLEYTVIGDAVNLAQRLESQARSGEVLVTEPVFEKIAAVVEAVPREAVKLKGKAHPVALWEIRRLKAAEAA
ncbi:MAG TPA: adenylate/guanylate cyclase domain-containing protein [Myxococcales bacterium]